MRIKNLNGSKSIFIYNFFTTLLTHTNTVAITFTTDDIMRKYIMEDEKNIVRCWRTRNTSAKLSKHCFSVKMIEPLRSKYGDENSFPPIHVKFN